jgi:histidinol phosphatase-like enzyme (inositol monophosphatase family)
MAPTAPEPADPDTADPDTADPETDVATLLDLAVDLVRDAGELTLEWFRRADLDVERKGDGTPVTAADRAAEHRLRAAIGDRFPDDTIVGEEEATHVGTSGRSWIIDPIDGTKAFTRGVPLYSNLLAINDEDGPLIGVINLPALGQIVYAARGRGCFVNGQPAHVSAPVGLDEAYLSSSSYSHWDDDALLRVKHTGCSLRTWGDGYGYALVATGAVDAMVDPEVSWWDVAPMPVILTEAGGTFTDFAGRTDATTGSALATGGADHAELLALLRAPG